MFVVYLYYFVICQVQVDGQRYVSLKNMWQTRFDDSSKRRAVRREIVPAVGDKPHVRYFLVLS